MHKRARICCIMFNTHTHTHTQTQTHTHTYNLYSAWWQIKQKSDKRFPRCSCPPSSRMLCLYIHTYTHTYIYTYIHIHIRKPCTGWWQNTQRCKKLSTEARRLADEVLKSLPKSPLCKAFIYQVHSRALTFENGKRGCLFSACRAPGKDDCERRSKVSKESVF